MRASTPFGGGECRAPLHKGTSDPSVGEGPERWEHLPPTKTRSHEGKPMSYA
jgi:hypothetical protein